MQHPAKIQFSIPEQSLMQNAEWILTKNAILEKMKWLLQQCQDEQAAVFNNSKKKLPPEILHTSPKISKGENYLGLPWLILDYPRHFEKEKAFAIRTLFWWGNFFSITLHLSGSYKKQLEKKILTDYNALKQYDFFICTGEDEWSHHFEKTNYTALNKMSEEDLQQTIAEMNFIKLAVKYDLSQWENMPEHTAIFTKLVLEILS